MDNRQWELAQRLFHEAVELPESEREAFLEAGCGDDLELLSELRNMLKADRLETSLLDRGLPDVAFQFVGSPGEAISLREFGPYRLKRLLGEGGMGVVWLAERADAGNLVAIKFLPHAGLSPARRERFTHEIKTLAKLKHPYIGRLYDAGTLADGTPWFVMEYVEGVRFTDYCRREERPVEARLRLFRSVCEAVQYAHGQEIIHRDLKPSNILVEQDGTPRLLDFGIARQLQGPDGLAEQTRPNLRFLSPDYAAPEWARDGIVGFYTDVYSLGVILYEMLAGRLPSAGAKRTPEGTESNTAEQHPDKPSVAARRLAEAGGATTGVSPLGKSAWSDLDVLCLKAMHQDAEARYPSVEALIRDIDHFLKGQPLEARPDTLRYRAGKFVRRNGRAAFATCAALVLIVGLVIFFTVRLAKERNRSLAEAARTQRVEGFLENLFEGGDEFAGPAEDLRVMTLLDRGVKEAQGLNRDPAVQADLYQTLRRVYDLLGKLDRADSLLHSALELRMSLFGSDHQEVAETLLALGRLRQDQAQLPDAERLIRQALAMDQRHLPPLDPAVARAKAALGGVLEGRGAYDKAIEVLNEAVRLEAAEGAESTEQESLNLLAIAHFHFGHYAIADSLNRQGLAIDRQVRGEHHPNVADDLTNLGHIQTQWGHYQQAEQYYRQALEIDQLWYGKDSPNTADIMAYVAQALTFQGRYDEAGSLLHQVLITQEHAYGKNHPRVALVFNGLGTIAAKRGKLGEAEADFNQTVRIYRSVYGEEHQNTAIAQCNLSDLYSKKGEYVRAELLLRDVIQRLTRVLPSNHFRTGVARIELGRALLGEKNYQEAERESLAGYEILTKQTSPSVSWLRAARKDLVSAYDAVGQPEKAAKFRAELAANEPNKADVPPAR